MDALTGIMPAIVAPTALARPSAAPALLKPAPAPELPVAQPAPEEAYDAPLVEQKRYAAVQRMAQDIANVNVLGTTTFAIFKDATGVLVTRFYDRLSGKVDYVPEPALMKLSRSDSGPAMTITA